MEFKDYYQILGVDKKAEADDIKKAYRKLARKFHPDVSKEPDAAKRMSEVNEAYAVLSDPEKRVAYDTLGERRAAGQEFHPPPGWDAGFEFSDTDFGDIDGYSEFFSSLFGRAGRSAHAGRSRTEAKMRGGDHHAKIIIDLADAYHGATRSVSLRGAHLDESGRVVTQDRVLDVQIPKGIKEGQSIRLRGQGGAGFGARRGLYLGCISRPTPVTSGRARRDADVPVAPWEAALGARSKSDAVGAGGERAGRVGDDRRLRLKGRGIPATAR
jgi:curved DNA-binding protein